MHTASYIVTAAAELKNSLPLSPSESLQKLFNLFPFIYPPPLQGDQQQLL